MTRTDLRSSRRGMAASLLHEHAKLTEQVVGVVRAWRGLRVVLDREHRGIQQPQSLDDAVVEVAMRDDRLAERRAERPIVRCLHGEAVIVAGDVDTAGAQVLDRLVDATMAESELVGAQAQGAAEDLAAQADAEDRDAGREHLAHRVDRVAGSGRVTGAVGEEHTVGFGRQDLAGGGVGGQHVNLAAAFGQPARGGGLDAQVHRGDPVPGTGAIRRADGVGLLGSDLPGQVSPGHLRAGQHPFQQLVRSGRGADGAPLSQVPGERAGAGDRDAGDPLAGQLVLQAAFGPPAGDDRGQLADHVAADPDPPRLVVLVVDAGVADVRGGHRDDLAAVGRVGQRLLVAGHPGAEDHLAERLAVGAERPPMKGPSVFQQQQRRPFCPRHQASFPSSTVGSPRRNVATTRPGSTMPVNGLLRLLEAWLAGSTASRGVGSYSVRLAGAPGSSWLPCPASRAILAGRSDIRSATSAQPSSPVSTMACWTTRSAVSRPVMPNAAVSHSVSLCSSGCGAWSVATQSMVPSARPLRSAVTSALVRSGGLTLYTGS